MHAEKECKNSKSMKLFIFLFIRLDVSKVDGFIKHHENTITVNILFLKIFKGK